MFDDCTQYSTGSVDLSKSAHIMLIFLVPWDIEVLISVYYIRKLMV